MLRHVASSLFRTQIAKSQALTAPIALSGTRFFADKAADDLQVPIKQYGVAGTYSEAIFLASAKAGKLDLVHGELSDIASLATSNKDFSNFCEDPVLAPAKKEEIITTLMTEMKMDQMTSNFLALMAQNGRLSEIPRVYDRLSEQVQASKGEIPCIVTTAKDELSAAELADARKKCERESPEGAIINLKHVVDKSIEGGWILDIGDKHLDYSVRTRTKKMDQIIDEALASM